MVKVRNSSIRFTTGRFVNLGICFELELYKNLHWIKSRKSLTFLLVFIWSDEIGVGKERFLCMIAALVLLARSYLHNTRFLKSHSINQIRLCICSKLLNLQKLHLTLIGMRRGGFTPLIILGVDFVSLFFIKNF